MTPRERQGLDVASKIMRAALLADTALALEACTEARELVASCDFLLLPPIDWAGNEGRPAPHRMRRACRKCGSLYGTVDLRGGQHVVCCALCASYCYCAPRAEVA
jgi:hypothetical protein